MANYEQNLEIQDKFVNQEYLKDTQITYLIYLQQINKISKYQKNYTL